MPMLAMHRKESSARLDIVDIVHGLDYAYPMPIKPTKLSFPERYAALLILSGVKTAGLKTWRVVEKTREMMQIDKEDIVNLDIKFQAGGISYDREKADADIRGYALSKEAIDFLGKRITDMDKTNGIPREVLPLAAKLGMY